MLAQNGVSSILFTLDPPRVDAGDDLVPFQTLRHLPGESLARTSLLETLAHTDYLLKMLTMGVEVSAKAPFRLRSASKALYKRLSFGDELEALVRISLYCLKQKIFNVHCVCLLDERSSHIQWRVETSILD